MFSPLELLAHLDVSALGDPTQPKMFLPAQPARSAEVTADPADRYHHPHYLGTEDGPWGETIWRFRAFTGQEPLPRRPDSSYRDKTLTFADRIHLLREYEAARIEWGHARMRVSAIPLLRQAAPLWQDWKAAHATLRGTFAAFRDTETNRWRAQCLLLIDAETAAQAAAAAWDKVAGQLAELVDEHLEIVGFDHALSLRTIAQDISLDAGDWLIGPSSSYQPERYWGGGATPVVGILRSEIRAQRTLLRGAVALADSCETAGRSSLPRMPFALRDQQ